MADYNEAELRATLWEMFPDAGAIFIGEFEPKHQTCMTCIEGAPENTGGGTSHLEYRHDDAQLVNQNTGRLHDLLEN